MIVYNKVLNPKIKFSLTYSFTHLQITGPAFSYNLRYIVGFGLVEMTKSTNPKPTSQPMSIGMIMIGLTEQ